MKYVAVLGVAPSISTIKPVTHYFDDYLVSIAEPTTASGWSLQDIVKQMNKIENKRLDNMELYLDSGGYQIITGHITERRLREFTDVYHFVLENFRNKIDYIFTLDINNPKFNESKIIKYNNYSIQESIKLHKQYPEMRDKQLFVVQSRTPGLMDDWKQLMEENEVFKYYDRYSFGGLVGLKSETKVQFNHFVPMTMWLKTFGKNHNANIKHIHMLGQSSRVAIITGTILEKLFDTKITMDSSEIIRFSPITYKVPMIHKNEDFNIIKNLEEMQDMVACHSDPEAHQEIENMKKDLCDGKVSNQTFVELISQNINNLIEFSEYLLEAVPVQEVITWNEDKFKEFHPIFNMGRLATEMANNMRLIQTLMPYYERGDFEGIHAYVKKIVGNYYEEKRNKTGVH